MAGESETLGAIRVKVEADLTKWKNDVESLKKDAKKDAEDIEKSYSSIEKGMNRTSSLIVRSFKGIDAAIVNNIKSTNDLIKVNDNLFLEVSKKTGKAQASYRILNDVIQKNVKGSVLGWQTLARVGETELNKSSRSVRIFGSGLGETRRKLGLFGYEIARAAGETGRFGTLMSYFASGMLTGGFIGAGLAAGAAAINLIAEKSKKLTETIKQTLSKLIDFKDNFKDIKFEIDTGNIRQQTKFIEDRIKKLQENITGRDVKLLQLRSTAGSDEVLIKLLEKQNETDEKRIKINEEYLEKLKEQKDLEDALGITKEELNQLGIKELTIVDKYNAELEAQKKIINNLKSALSDPNVKGDLRLALQNELNKAIEDYNSLIGKGDEVDLIDKTIEKLQTQMEIRELTYTLTKEFLESTKATLEALEKTVTNEEDRLKILKEIARINKELKDFEFEFEVLDDTELTKQIDENIRYEIEKRQQLDERRKQVEEELKDLRISAISDEFSQREAAIDLEFERQKAYLEELYNKKLLSEEELAEAITNIEKQREGDLARLSREKFETALGSARSIANVLHNAFGDNTLINQLTRALEIAEQIAVVIQSINILSSLFGNPTAAAGALAKGGSVVNTGSKVSVTPWSRVPKFARGVDDFIVPSGFPNDSFPIRVQSGERVTVTPAHEVPKLGGMSSDSLRILNGIYNRLGVLNMNVSALEMKVDVINNAPDVETQVRRNKKVESKLSRSGVKFNEQS